MIDMITLGELLIDFTPAGEKRQPQPVYAKCGRRRGQRSCCAVNTRRFKAAYMGMVGNDQFGHFLKRHAGAANASMCAVS